MQIGDMDTSTTGVWIGTMGIFALLLVGGVCSETFYSNNIPPLCPGEVAVYTCNVPTYSLATSWRFSPSSCAKNSVELTLDPATCAKASQTCGGFVAQNGNVVNGVCSTSTLSVMVTEETNDAVIECFAEGQFASQLIGQYSLKVISTPLVLIRASETLNEITVETNVSSYAASMAANVSLLDSSNNTLFMVAFNDTFNNVTFHGLQSDTGYFVKVMVANCAGSTELIQPTHTLARPPTVINTTLVVDDSKVSRYLEVEWFNTGSSIGEYEITIEDDFGFEETKTVYCKSDTCKCIQELTTNSHSYAIHLSSINAEGINGPETISFTNATNYLIQNVQEHFMNYHQATIGCLFSQSFYCVVCCSTDPSVPPDSSVYNISTSRGTEVTVDLDGLTSGQMYYCKAAATNTNSASCGGPVAGGVKVLTSFTTSQEAFKVLSISGSVEYSAQFITFVATVCLALFVST